MLVRGESRDSAWLSMLDSEWPARRRAFEAWLAPENFDAEGRQRFGWPHDRLTADGLAADIERLLRED